MALPPSNDLQAGLRALDAAGADRACRVVDVVLGDAVRRAASDVHFEPTPAGVDVRFRLDGVLHTLASFGSDIAPNVIARLKVLAELLTYRVDIPQEGRVPDAESTFGVPLRVSTFPTIHGEKAAVRLFHPSLQALTLDQLGLPEPLRTDLHALLRERAGAIFLTGPSGSGKTTTIYACLRHLVAAGGRHLVTIEDPVEQVLAGVSQAQVKPGSEFDFARGLRSLLRQDPEVIMVGEVRDPDTAAVAIEAALTGHLVFSTLHAGSACGVLGRLLEMGIEPYLLTSGLRAILNQRLVRRRCSDCNARGCDACAGSGHRGRLLLAELLTLYEPLRRAILARSDTAGLEAVADAPGRQTLRTAAERAVADGLTTAAEVERILGPRKSPAGEPVPQPFFAPEAP